MATSRGNRKGREPGNSPATANKGCAAGAASFHHPDWMTVREVWYQGKLQEKTVEFSHTCGRSDLDDFSVQTNLPSPDDLPW